MSIEEFNDAIKNKLFGDYELKEDVDHYGNSNSWIVLHDKRDMEVVAKAVKSFKGRCVVATGYLNEMDGTHTVIYHFDINGMIMNAQINTNDKTVISITPILRSADWAERELREMYDVEPVGHPTKDRLFLDYSIAKGVLNEYISLSKIQMGVSDTDVLWSQVNKGVKV
ncbi:MAG: NADH-quinone oxidoreductase subunit C [Sulfurovum sp.]|nr:NADH-quinone oxidoreductase subunit C [Sulfurovum sp.]